MTQKQNTENSSQSTGYYDEDDDFFNDDVFVEPDRNKTKTDDEIFKKPLLPSEYKKTTQSMKMNNVPSEAEESQSFDSKEDKALKEYETGWDEGYKKGFERAIAIAHKTMTDIYERTKELPNIKDSNNETAFTKIFASQKRKHDNIDTDTDVPYDERPINNKKMKTDVVQTTNPLMNSDKTAQSEEMQLTNEPFTEVEDNNIVELVQKVKNEIPGMTDMQIIKKVVESGKIKRSFEAVLVRYKTVLQFFIKSK